MGFLTIFEDLFRWLIWILLKFMLFICDQLYSAVKSIAYFDMMSDASVWTYYEGFMAAFLVFFIVFRVAKRYLKSLVDEEEAERFRPDNLLLKIASIGFLIVIVPFLLKSFGNLLSQLIDKIEVIFSVNSNDFSSVLISSADIGAGTYNEIKGWDINEKIGGDYVHIPDLNAFLCLFIATVFSFYLMMLIGIQLGGRLLSMMMKLIIAPYSFSSIIDEKNDSFTTWWHLFIADFMATYIQMLLLLVGTTLIMGFNFNAGNAFTSGLAKDIALIGALFGVLNAPNGISQIIGTDIGVSSALQSLQTTMMATNITQSAGSFITNAATYAAAGATYGTGRLLGGASMKSIVANTIPGLTTLSGSIQGGPGGWGDGQNSQTGGNADLNLTMKESSPQQPSFVSQTRGGVSGIQPNSGTMTSAAFNTNVAKVVSNYANFGSNSALRTVAQGVSWGSNRAYGAAMNRISKGFNGQSRPANDFMKKQNNLMMYNFSSPSNPGSPVNGGSQ